MDTGGMLVATASYKSQLLLLLFPGAGQCAGVPGSSCIC